MTTEQALLYLVAAVAAVWAVVKVLLPRIVDTRLKGQRDEQEHRQKLEEERHLFQQMDNAGWASKAAELLELHESFLREEVWKKLECIEVVMTRFERAQVRTSDELAIIGARLMRIEDTLDQRYEERNGPTEEESD